MSHDSDPNPYAPPTAKEDPPPVPVRTTASLTLSIDQPIPPVCLKCGATGELTHRPHNFVWVPPERARNQVVWGAMFGAVGGALAGAANAKHQKSAKFEIPVCWSCNVRWTNGKLMALGSVLSIFAVFLFAALIGVKGNGPLVLVLMAASMASMFLAARAAKKSSLFAIHIDDETALIGGVAPLAVERVAEMKAQPAKKRRKRKPAADSVKVVESEREESP